MSVKETARILKTQLFISSSKLKQKADRMRSMTRQKISFFRMCETEDTDVCLFNHLTVSFALIEC